MTEKENDVTTVVVLEHSRWLLADVLDVDTAMTLIALVSEDPADWTEAMDGWPRYCTPAVAEFASGVPMEETDRESVTETLRSSEAWVAIDFRSKRLLTGGNFQEVGRDATFAMVVDESGKQQFPMSVHLPPWWELHELVTADELDQPRQSPIDKPVVNREILFGDVMLMELATRVLETIKSDAWRTSGASDNEQARYPFTVTVHRDWLMTPREDLGGRMPRELLHGATQWSDRVTWGQRIRFENGGPMVAAPRDWDGFATAPMGSQEMCLYFDLCRELINAAWFHVTKPNESPITVNALSKLLGDVKDNWLESPFQGVSPPSFMIECDRRRVPRGVGVAIEGIDGEESDSHLVDCDCPVCQMMADGVFGVGFTSIDGHHLELDDEFAFSMLATRTAWEEQQKEDAEIQAEMDRRWAKHEANSDAVDPFASAWTGIGDDRPIPGDTSGVLKMAFMVAEVVSELETSDADRDDITSLNECFAHYRRSGADDRRESASELKANLQTLADRYPQLTSRSVDLQSRIDESLRNPAIDENDLDFPF